MTSIELLQLSESGKLNEGEMDLFKWQHHSLGDFSKGLWQAISHADLQNLARLELAFPLQVQAYRDWAHTGILLRKFESILTSTKQ